MHESTLVIDSAPGAAEAPVALYAFPARAWHRDEYAGLRGSAVGAALAVVCEPQGALGWAQSSVPQLAQRYAERIEAEERGRGRPVALLGWSVGALVALEVAQRLKGRLAVAWVGSIDASLFTPLRQQLGQMPPLAQHEQAELEAVKQRWLERSSLRACWEALLRQMGPAEYGLFLHQVVAAYGAALPTDGPQPGSQEHALWSRLNCLRLGLGYEPPAVPPAPLRWWRSAEVAGEPDTLRERYAAHAWGGQGEVIEGSSHLSVLDAPRLHELLARVIEEAQGRSTFSLPAEK